MGLYFFTELYALALAHIADLIINGDILKKKSICSRLVILAPIVGGCFVDAYRLFNAHYSKIIMDSAKVSFEAHVAGGFTGLFCGTFLLKNYDTKEWELVLQKYFLWIYAFVFGAISALSFVNFNVNNYPYQGIVKCINADSVATVRSIVSFFFVQVCIFFLAYF